MKRVLLVALVYTLALGLNASSAFAKGGKSQGKGQGQRAEVPTGTNASIHSNGQRTADRDYGLERAKETGKGKKKGLYKDHQSAGKHEGWEDTDPWDKDNKKKDKQDKDKKHKDDKHKDKPKDHGRTETEGL